MTPLVVLVVLVVPASRELLGELDGDVGSDPRQPESAAAEDANTTTSNRWVRFMISFFLFSRVSRELLDLGTLEPLRVLSGAVVATRRLELLELSFA